MGTKEGRKIYGEFAGRFKGFYLETTGQLGSRGVWQQDAAVSHGFGYDVIHDGGYKDIRSCRADDLADRIGYVISGGVCFELCDRQNP